MNLGDLLQQVFQQYGLLGLVIVFLIFGPGFTYFRTRNVRIQTEAKAQEVLNEFIKQERQRADRLEARLNEALDKLNLAEDEVAQLRLRLSEAQSDLDQLAALKRQVRKLTQRVTELEGQLETKQNENEELRLEIARHESHSARIHDLERKLEAPNQEEK